MDSKERQEIMTFTLKNMLHNMKDIFFVKNIDLVYINASQSFAELVGFKDVSDIIGKTDDQLFADEDLVLQYTRDDRKLISSGEALEAYTEPIGLAGGQRRYCQTSKFPLCDDEGNIIGLCGISRDVTWEYKAKLNYERELNSFFKLPPDALSAALFDVTNWRIVDARMVSNAAKKRLEFKTPDDFLFETINAISYDEKMRDFYRSLSKENLLQMYESGKRRLSVEYQRNMLSKKIRWVRNDLHFISDPINGNVCVMSTLRDIENKKQAQQALIRAAEIDALTGVYNRETTMAQINRFLKGEGSGGTHLLYMIDIDNFKLVNDTFGHQTGDEALIHIATVIRKVFRESDIVGRIGGDEFFALMKNVEQSVVGHKRALELVEVLQYQCAEGADSVTLSGSIGISCYNGDGKTLEKLYAEADEALYKAKHRGKNRYVFSDGSVSEWSEKESLNAVNLRTLLENMDAYMFQTELDGEELRIAYSSHSLFRGANNEQQEALAHGENLWDIIMPEDSQLLKKAIRKASADGSVLDFNCRVKKAQGVIEWRHVRGSKLPSQGDGVHRMIHVATDISNQKKIEVQLREKSSIIDFAMRNTDVNLWYFNLETATCQLTKSCQKKHEMPGVEELKDFPQCLFEMGYVREDCIELLENTYKTFKKTGESAEFDVWFRRADGSGWWCEREVISPLINEAGEITEGIGIGKDVTAEKTLQEKYEAFGSFRHLSDKGTRVSFRMNLSANHFDEGISGKPEIQEIYQTTTVDEFLQKVRNRVISKEDLEYFDQGFLRLRLLEAFSRGETTKTIECRYRIEQDQEIWIRINVEMSKNPTTYDVEALFYSVDIDYDKNMNLLVDKLLEVDYEFLGLIDVNTRTIMVLGEQSDTSELAQNGGNYDEEMRRVFKGLILEEYYEEGVRTMQYDYVVKELETKKYYICSFPAREYANTSEGRKQWKFGYTDGSKTKIVIARTDITTIYTSEYDSLTGLYNRTAFYRHTKQLIGENPTEEFLLVRFDIDRFKAYNDLYGTQEGDRLLAAIGREQREQREQTGISLFVAGRLQADHFVFVAVAKDFNVKEWNKKHIQFLNTITDGYRLNSSVGVYPIKDPTIKISLMTDRALLALKTVKDNYSKKIAWYSESLREHMMLEQTLVDDMEEALKEEQFRVFFQPQFNYGSGSLIGAEALVRWQHPKLGLIPPNEFIPLFEKNGFILKLDGFVWRKSCEYLKLWREKGMDVMPVSVNVSRCDLYEPHLCKKIQALVEQCDIPTSLLKLEITESAYTEDPEQLVEVVKELRSAGFVVEMDDFGTGYSSLNMLKDIPVDVLKLDTRFISESKNGLRSTTILSSVISMAHEIGVAVIAEGIETKQQADFLQSMNCSDMQGYYFGRPMPADDFQELICKK